MPRALQSFPAASITDSLKESFLSLVSVSLDWNQLFQVRQTSSLCFPVLRQPPGKGACQEDLGRADYWGPGLRQIQNINSVRAHLSLQFICFIVFPQDFTTLTQRHKFSTMTTHTHFFSLTVMAVAVSIYHFGWSCLVGIQFNIQSCKSTIKLWGEVRKYWGLTDPVPFLCLHLCPVTQVHRSPPVFHLVFNASFPHPHSDLYRWMDCYPPLLFRISLALCWSSLLRANPFSRRWLHREYWLRWEVTFQTSCDFRCEIKWADFPVSDKHPVTDEGYFKESALCSDPPRHHLFGITSARTGLSDSAPLKRLWLKW